MEKEAPEKEHEDLTVDFSQQELKKIERAGNEQEAAVCLILDHNEIQKLENLETYPNLKKFSATNNQIIRMYGVSHLVHLVTIDLSSNSITTIEGLKNLKQLKHLNLAKNRIKSMEHLSNNLKLERVDLSENNITRISDISHLENLKSLNLHGNRINLLTHCEKKLPVNLEVLTLNNNSLTDLNEISHLSNLTSLRELSIVNNPCLDFSEDQKFNYRPFVKNWCTSLIVLDNRPLDDIECLKAEWLYSQGRGRSFRPGEHAALIEYLLSVCPREQEENVETEDVKKLKLILSKAHLHQQQLREQLSTGKFSGEGFRCPVLKKKSSGIPERMITSVQDYSVISMSGKELQCSPELMTRSLDSGMMKKSPLKPSKTDLNQTPLQTCTTFIPIPDSLISPDVKHPNVANPARPSSISSRTSHSSSRNSPYSTPESKRKTFIQSTIVLKQNKNSSPVAISRQEKLNYSRCSTPFDQNTSSRKCRSPRIIASPSRRGIKSRDIERNFRKTSEDDEDSEILALKIRAVQERVNQRKLNKSYQTEKSKEHIKKKGKLQNRNPFDLNIHLTNNEEWRAAVCIQKWWRGYCTRNLNREVVRGCRSIQMSRVQDYIIKVMKDIETTRMALEGNKKLAILQMQAINALWKKISTVQPSVGADSGENQASIQDLVQTCTILNKQVEELQAMMKTIQAASSVSSSLIPTSTQTDIVAVHTPDGDGREKFPYNSNLKPKLEENSNFIIPVERDDNSLRYNSTDSDSSPKTCSLKDVTQLFMASRINDGSNNSCLVPLEEKDMPLSSETLTKPAVKLNDNKYEKLFFPPRETDNFKQEEFKNS